MLLNQRTLAESVSCKGVGVHSGKTVHMTINPAPINHGIKFVRTDLPDRPALPAHFHMVVDTSLATVIGYDGFIVSTIEHLMATFAGLSVDNALVELDAYELPIMDGSAKPYTELILSAGIQEQIGPRCYFVVKDPIEISEGDKFVGVYPASSFRITYTIEFPHPFIGKQVFSSDINENVFVNEIAESRTFGFYQEVEYLKRYGFARGGSLDNVVVLDKENIINPDGLRYTDEFVRHKVLDSLGDLSLLGLPILGHVVLRKSGHQYNHAFIKTFFSRKDSWETLTLHNLDDPTSDQPKALAI